MNKQLLLILEEMSKPKAYKNLSRVCSGIPLCHAVDCFSCPISYSSAIRRNKENYINQAIRVITLL